MVDGVSMNPTGGSGDVKSGKKDVKQNSNNSVFSSYDENKDGSVTANEMGIKKTLNNILKNLEKFATSDKFANVLRNIKNIATNLLKDSSLPIHQISNIVGIDDFNYFSRLFKKSF